MCARYYFDIDLKELRKIAEEAEKNLYDEYKSGEIFPSYVVPICIAKNKSIKPVLAEWGIPKWDGKGIIINARAESINYKAMFKDLNKTNRCLIPASAFFEWKKDSMNIKAKKKYIFRNPDSILYMAGLYEEFEHSVKNEQLSLFDDNSIKKHIYFTIITKNANFSVSPIHDRMPLIFNNHECDCWLEGENIEKLISTNNFLLTREAI